MLDPHEPTRSTPEQRFAQLMKETREASGWSQEELARRVSAATGVTIHQTGITRIENGTRNVRLNEAVALAQVLSIEMHSFDANATDPDVLEEQRIRTALATARDLRRQYDEGAYKLQAEIERLVSRHAERMHQIQEATAAIEQLEVMLKVTQRRISERFDGHQ